MWAKSLGDVKESRFPIFFVVIEYQIRVVYLIVSEAQFCRSEPCCQVKELALLLAVEVAADLWGIVMAVGVLARCFDEDNVEMFRDIS